MLCLSVGLFICTQAYEYVLPTTWRILTWRMLTNRAQRARRRRRRRRRMQRIVQNDMFGHVDDDTLSAVCRASVCVPQQPQHQKRGVQ